MRILYNKVMEFHPDLIRFLHNAERVAVITGAGVSQESGLRTFRDPLTGIWRQNRPEDIATPEAFRRDPRLVWDWYTLRREKMREVQPNPGHYALVELAKYFPHFTLITQNMDGLHQKAGSVDVIELHGNLARVKCFECGEYASAWVYEGDHIPRCELCNGLLRPAVVWFGEALPRAALEAAVDVARRCHVFFSIGTSGVVQPAASLAYAAKNQGAALVEINLEPTALTERVDFAFHGKSGEILPALVAALRQGD